MEIERERARKTVSKHPKELFMCTVGLCYRGFFCVYMGRNGPLTDRKREKLHVSIYAENGGMFFIQMLGTMIICYLLNAEVNYTH